MDLIRILWVKIELLQTFILWFLQYMGSKWKVLKLKRAIQRSESECPKKNENHNNGHRIPFLEFKEKIDENFSIAPKIVTFTKIMGKLTGIMVTTNGSDTCFLQRIRRLKNAVGESGDRAVLTFTTVYHAFGVEDSLNGIFKLAREWKNYKTEVILFYDEKIDDFYMEKKCPHLKEFRLLVTDKEEGIENDWCAIECEVNCDSVYESNGVERNLVNALEHYLESYKRKQKEIYESIKNNTISNDNLVVTIGHPHGRPKQVSVGRHYPLLKDEPKKVRSSQLWCRYYYDAPTCIGNSGSPVFIPGQPIAGFGFWFGHQHNHKSDVTSTSRWARAKRIYPDIKCLGMSSIGVEQC
ncbi:acidic repeat-containing protein isoform X2 [Biomphalaria glabrata]|nr:acidic repeat-containing protein isoform X2 [Biomphalaria glabrata]